MRATDKEPLSNCYRPDLVVWDAFGDGEYLHGDALLRAAVLEGVELVLTLRLG